MKVDAHQHFWDPGTAHYSWMSDAVAPLCRRFGPTDLEPLLRGTGFDCSIIVQARSEVSETEELLAMVADHPFIAAVVGWADLSDAGLDGTLDALAARADGAGLVGIRHQVEDEPDVAWLSRSDVQRGLKAVGERGLVYDLLLRPPNIESAIGTVRAHPDLRFVVDHIAKPLIKTGELEPWESLMRTLATHENVWCKISGLVTEADHESWTVRELKPYVERIVDMFGTGRILYGSDWPVVLLASSYEEALQSTLDALPSLTDEELAAFLGGNAAEVYRLHDLVPGG